MIATDKLNVNTKQMKARLLRKTSSGDYDIAVDEGQRSH